MIKFPFFPNKSIDFIACKESNEITLTKFCPICNNVLGSIGIVHSQKRVCWICKRAVCKPCANRKITEKEFRICKDCFKEGLENFYMSSAIKDLTQSLISEDNEVKIYEQNFFELKEKYKIVSNELTECKKKLAEAFALSEKSLVNHQITLQEQDEKCKSIREKISQKQQKIEKYEQVAKELSEQIAQSELLIVTKQKILSDLRDDLSGLQDEGTCLTNKFEKKMQNTPNSEIEEKGNYVKSVKELKKVSALKQEENDELMRRQKNLEKEIEQINYEIISYGARTSCRYSGIFSEDFFEKSGVSISSSLEKDLKSYEQALITRMKEFEENSKTNDQNGPACFGCALF